MNFFEYLLKKESIALNLVASDWKDAIRKGGSLLLQAGCCEGKYIDAMIDNCIKNGPYFILAPGLAMPHARPEHGVIGSGYALVTLRKGVDFGDSDNDPIDVLIFMAAKDNKTHAEESMSQIAQFCDNENWILELRTAKKITSVFEILGRAEKQCVKI